MEKSADFSNLPFHKKGRNGKRHLATVGLQPSRSGKMHFPAATPPVKKQLRNDRSRFGAANYKNNFSADIATATTAACGRRLPPAGGRCRIATKEGMQGGAVGAVASRMQGPLKGRSSRWVPQLVQSEAETILNQIFLNAPSQNPPARLRRSGGAPVSAPASRRIPGGTVPETAPAPAAVRCRSPSKSRTSRW